MICELEKRIKDILDNNILTDGQGFIAGFTREKAIAQLKYLIEKLIIESKPNN